MTLSLTVSQLSPSPPGGVLWQGAPLFSTELSHRPFLCSSPSWPAPRSRLRRAEGPISPGRGASHTIRGKIFMPSGNPPDQRLRVVLEVNTGGNAGEAFSDSMGNFEFRSLSNGTYKIVTPSDGRVYETSQETVEVYGNFSRTFTVQIYLKEKGEGCNRQNQREDSFSRRPPTAAERSEEELRQRIETRPRKQAR